MIVKILTPLAYFVATFVGLAMLPYLLVRVWGNRDTIKEEGKGLRF